MSQHALERPSTLMIAQRMSNVAARLLHIQRHAPVALLVGRDLIQSKELPVNAIRNGQMVRVRLSELTAAEQRTADVNLFHSEV
jgi:ribosome recycling factor